MGEVELFGENNRGLSGRVYQLDEGIVDKRSHRSKKNALSQNSEATYKGNGNVLS